MKTTSPMSPMKTGLTMKTKLTSLTSLTKRAKLTSLTNLEMLAAIAESYDHIIQNQQYYRNCACKLLIGDLRYLNDGKKYMKLHQIRIINSITNYKIQNSSQDSLYDLHKKLIVINKVLNKIDTNKQQQ